MDQRAGLRPVDQGGSSGSKTEKSTQPVSMQCSEPGVASVASDVTECISIVPLEDRDHDSSDCH